jgi:hypothetical protein
MTTIVVEVYEALKKAGIDDETARSSARAVVGAEEKAQLATKADIEVIRREMAELKVDIIKWNVGAMAVLTAIFSAIVKLL